MPNLLAYDPAFAYEIAVIIQDGIKRMYVEGESIFYYLTVGNEPLPMPGMPSQPARWNWKRIANQQSRPSMVRCMMRAAQKAAGMPRACGRL